MENNITVVDGVVTINTPTSMPVTDYVAQLIADATKIQNSINSQMSDLANIQAAIVAVQSQITQ